MYNTPVTAAERLAALEAAALAGETVTPAQLAAAQAEAAAETELAQLIADGEATRAAAALALATSQAAAKDAVREDLPLPPTTALNTAVQAARTAIQAAVAVRTAYAATIDEAKQTLAEGGVIERGSHNGTTLPLDDDNHGHAHQHAITIDGVTYSTASCTDALVDLARYTLQLAGTGHRVGY